MSDAPDKESELAAIAAQSDERARDAGIAALKSLWKGEGEFDRTLGRVKELVGTLPAERFEAANGMRFPDGTPLFSDPVALQWLADPARTEKEIQGLPTDSRALEQVVEKRIAAIEAAGKYQRNDAFERELQHLYRVRERFNT